MRDRWISELFVIRSPPDLEANLCSQAGPSNVKPTDIWRPTECRLVEAEQLASQAVFVVAQRDTGEATSEEAN